MVTEKYLMPKDEGCVNKFIETLYEQNNKDIDSSYQAYRI